MAYGTVTVSDTATKIVDAQTDRQELTLVNNSENVVYLGQDDSVTTSNGVPLYETQTQNRSLTTGFWRGPVYGIVSSGSSDVRYWEVIGR